MLQTCCRSWHIISSPSKRFKVFWHNLRNVLTRRATYPTNRKRTPPSASTAVRWCIHFRVSVCMATDIWTISCCLKLLPSIGHVKKKNIKNISVPIMLHIFKEILGLSFLKICLCVCFTHTCDLHSLSALQLSVTFDHSTPTVAWFPYPTLDVDFRYSTVDVSFWIPPQK